MEALDKLIVLLDKPDDEMWGQYFIDDAEKIYKENFESLLPEIIKLWTGWKQERQMHLACILGVVGCSLELELIKELMQHNNQDIANYAKDALDEFKSIA